MPDAKAGPMCRSYSASRMRSRVTRPPTKAASSSEGGLLRRLVEHLLGVVVDHDGRFEVLKLRLRSKDGLNCLLEGWAVSFLRRLDILPEVNAAASLGPLICSAPSL